MCYTGIGRVFWIINLTHRPPMRMFRLKNLISGEHNHSIELKNGSYGVKSLSFGPGNESKGKMNAFSGEKMSCLD